MARLQRIAGLVADTALVPVAEATAALRAIEARIAALSDHRAKLLRSVQDPHLAGPMLAQAERLRRAQAIALAELATARVALEAARAQAATAVGRDRALRKLGEGQARAAQRAAARRHLT